MLSRRNIRIKILQSLYMFNRDPELSKVETIQFYNQLLVQSKKLYLFNLFGIINTAKWSVEDEKRRKNKYLPSELDQKFTAKLFQNDLIQALVSNPRLDQIFKTEKLEELIDEETSRSIYTKYRQEDSYKEYIMVDSTNAHHMMILLDLYKFITKNEAFLELLDSHFPTWDDDYSLIIGAIKKTIKALPENDNLFATFRPDHEAAFEFGEKLLEIALDKDEELEQTVEPLLQNWDIDRVANIDIILIKMALAEFLYFESIPTKVTINEYVEIAKLYSTEKSKEFINGVLDKLMKNLEEENKIVKKGRGLID